MIAAAKLYPQAWLVFPGSIERNLQNFFIESNCLFYNFIKINNLPLERIKRLILVDTRQKNRLGPLAKLSEFPKVEIHVYDHHPNTPDDISAYFSITEQVGATITILSQILRIKKIKLTKDEATIMALGIYEDTGNFKFVSSTSYDFEAAGWLLAQGANLSLISSFITREINTQELTILNELNNSSHKITINGVELVIGEIYRENYLPELAILIHKFMNMDNINVLFILAHMEGKIHLVARSRLPEVDVRKIAKKLGGGGHPTAASATIRKITLLEAKEYLIELLKKNIKIYRTAADIMSWPAITINSYTKIQEANTKFINYNINMLPVIEKNLILGVVNQEIIKKACHQGLKNIPVSEYIDQEVQYLETSSSWIEIKQAIIKKKSFILVMEQGYLMGVITRTNLINILIDHPILPIEKPKDLAFRIIRQKNITNLIREYLPQKIIKILIELSLLAKKLNYRVYLVGGSVRDILLRRPNLDLDIVIEGDAITFAKKFIQNHLNIIQIKTYSKFNTAKIIYNEDIIIDIATARKEYYQAPAALPIIQKSSIKLDLYRRDFTINTLAICININLFGTLIDFFDGARDIKEKIIRILHNLSFIEDPTRIFRAIRFEQRFGFQISKLTETLIKQAIKINIFKHLTGRRLLNELILILEEKRVINCLLRLNELDLLKIFHSKLKLKTQNIFLLEHIEEIVSWFKFSFLNHPLRQWLLLFLGLTDSLTIEDLKITCQRLDLSPKLCQELIKMKTLSLINLEYLQKETLSYSQIYYILKPLKIEYQLYIMAKTVSKTTKKAINKFLTKLENIHPFLNGNKLKKIGIMPSPIYKNILTRLQIACLDGEVSTEEQEIKLVYSEFLPLPKNK